MFETFSPKLNGLAESNGNLAVVDRPIAAKAVKAAKKVEVDMGPIWTEVVDLTPDLAATLVESCSYQYQRPIRKSSVEFYKAEMREGRFAPTVIRVCHLGPQAMMTDGYHRCHAVIESGCTVPVTIMHLRKESMAEVEADYYRTDIGTSRTPADAYVKLVGESGLNKTQLNTIGAAVILIAQGFTATAESRTLSRSRDLRISGIQEWLPYAKEYLELVSCAENNLLQALRQRAAVVAVGMVTLRYCPDKAKEFWRAVAMNEGLLRGMPERTLVGFLIESSSTGINAFTYSRYIALAWNAFTEGRELHRLGSGATGRIIINGTPYGGRVKRREVKQS